MMNGTRMNATVMQAACLLVLSFVVAVSDSCAQDMTQAEAKRLLILHSERKQVMFDLTEELDNYNKADAESRKAIGKRITTLQHNLRDLDTEIENTGKMPEIKDSGEPFQVKQKPKPKEEPKEPTKSKHESWDVFRNF